MALPAQSPRNAGSRKVEKREFEAVDIDGVVHGLWERCAAPKEFMLRHRPQGDSMDKHGSKIALALAAAALLAGCAGVPTAETFTPMALRECEALAGMNIPASAIGLPT